jgi:hypothetical protein
MRFIYLRYRETISVPPLRDWNVNDDPAISIVSEESRPIYHRIMKQSTGRSARCLSRTLVLTWGHDNSLLFLYLSTFINDVVTQNQWYWMLFNYCSLFLDYKIKRYMRRIHKILDVVSSIIRTTSVARENVFSFQKLFLFLTTSHVDDTKLHIIDTIKTSQTYPLE